MSESASDRIRSGESWKEFCAAIEAAGSIILAEGAPDDVQTRAEGFRYLSRLARVALEAFVEHADPLAPVLFRPVHETVKMGADNPDNHYLWAAISGEQGYRIRGRRGSVHYLGFGTYAGFYGGGPRRATGYLEGSDLVCDPDGSFELQIACQRPEGAVNWLPAEPDSAQLIVRQTFLDHERERAAELLIERLGGDGRPSPLTAERLDAGLGQAGRLVLGAASLFSSWAEQFRSHVNELPEFDPETSLAAGGDPHIVYYHSYWALEPGQALQIDFTPPECQHWNFQLDNHWMESLDYRYFRVWLNKHTAEAGPEGRVRIVVAHEDPGCPNWIQTAGHRFGTMCLRWVRPAEKVQPRCRVLPLEELRP
ncbi:MAG: DUF1214 domain-containing protein [Deltaproteobacteria bacterium]|nr:DUF1214 domain-containing protein [Deltaproteobacteria bacterium]